MKLTKIRSCSSMKALCIRPLSTAYSSNRNDDFVILLHERKINSIKNLDQIIF